MKVQEDGSVLYAVYGTLRKGYGNHRGRLDGPTVEFLGEMKTEPKYTMVGKGAGFPYVAEGGNTSITVEIYKTKDPRVMQTVNGLEGYSGKRNHPSNWYDTCDLETPWGTANMFTMNSILDRARPDSIIKTGDFKNQD